MKKKNLVTLRVEKVVCVRNKYSYVVTFRNYAVRVPLFEHQIGQKPPQFIDCRVVGYNDFGYPTLEQIPMSSEVQLIEPAKPMAGGAVAPVPVTCDDLHFLVPVQPSPDVRGTPGLEQGYGPSRVLIDYLRAVAHAPAPRPVVYSYAPHVGMVREGLAHDQPQAGGVAHVQALQGHHVLRLPCRRLQGGAEDEVLRASCPPSVPAYRFVPLAEDVLSAVIVWMRAAEPAREKAYGDPAAADGQVGHLADITGVDAMAAGPTYRALCRMSAAACLYGHRTGVHV